MTVTLEAPAHLPLKAFYGLLGAQKPRLALSDALRSLLKTNRAFLESRLAEGAPLYGINTGFGNSSSQKVSQEGLYELQRNLTRYHGCGLGELLSEPECRAILLVRIVCLLQGKSGISDECADALLGLWNKGVTPCIPRLGSVGASGDLTPLSYVAAVLQGEREAYVDGARVDAASALEEAGLRPYTLKPKEGLALMNGTAVMTGLALLAIQEARVFGNVACECTGLLVEVLGGRVSPYRAVLHAAKPHKGNKEAAARILAFVAADDTRRDVDALTLGAKSTGAGGAQETRLQDSYSLRCAPQVVGALYDALTFAESVLEVELNSVNDNPVVLHEEGVILNGGHFFGSHVALVCDALKPAVANVAGLLDRQLAILVDGRFSNGLPDNLVDVRTLGASASRHHGLKALQISMSAVTAEALKNTMPASVFSRPTECLNQDVVSRDLLGVLSLATWAGALQVFALCQAAHVTPEKEFEGRLVGAAREWLTTWRASCAPVTSDRALDRELTALRGALFERFL